MSKNIGACPYDGICVCRASGARRRSDECKNLCKRQEAKALGKAKLRALKSKQPPDTATNGGTNEEGYGE